MHNTPGGSLQVRSKAWALLLPETTYAGQFQQFLHQLRCVSAPFKLVFEI